jgi:hypothetical protein
METKETTQILKIFVALRVNFVELRVIIKNISRRNTKKARSYTKNL